MSLPRPVIFHGPRKWYHADTCRPLEAAASAGKVRFCAVGHPPYPCLPMAGRLLPELRTLGYWDARNDQEWGLDWHRNEGIEFTYLARGQVDFAVDGCDYHLRHGHLTITRPWQRHRVGAPNVTASRLHWLILDVGVRRPNQPWRWPKWLVLSDAELSRLTRLLRYNEHPVWRAEPHLGRRFEVLSGLCDEAATKIDATRLKLCINELLLEVLDLLTSKNIALDQSLTSTLRHVELFLADLRHHLDHPWTVDAMAGHCGLGRTRFAHYCQQITNLSPLEYLTRLRIEAAQILLRTRPEMTVTQVAMACGFSSSQYFATVFRQRTGRAPRECRE
jgi:AraC family L-rhamnose operon regulatory protein RhaS